MRERENGADVAGLNVRALRMEGGGGGGGGEDC